MPFPDSNIQRGSRYWWLASIPLMALLAIPILVLVFRVQGRDFFDSLHSEEVLRPLALSLYSSSLATFLAVLLGTPVAYLLGRCKFRGRVLLEVLIELPTVLPPAVAGLALLLTLGRRGPIGQILDNWGLDMAFTFKAVVIAQLFVAAPYFIKAASGSLATVDHDLVEAAALDGASSFRIFWHVLLPLSWRGFAGGLGLCWARALGEFGATVIFAGNSPGVSQTMPLAIYLGFETDYKIAITLSVVMLVFSFGLLFLIRAALEKQAKS